MHIYLNTINFIILFVLFCYALKIKSNTKTDNTNNGLARLFFSAVFCLFYCLSHYCAQISRAKVQRQEPGYEFKNSWDGWWKKRTTTKCLRVIEQNLFFHCFCSCSVCLYKWGRERESAQETILNHDRFKLFRIAIEDWTDDTLSGYIIYHILCMIARRKCALACN